MGRLDHVHIRVPDRAEAATWYAEHLGFEPVEKYDFWATGFDGGPLQISADGGATTLALFEAGAGHPMVAQKTGVAFSVDAETFSSFTRSLPGEINSPLGRPLVPDDVIDFDMCWAFDLADPWGNQYELNCYDYDRIKTDLIEPDGIAAVRYCPASCTRSTPSPDARASLLTVRRARPSRVRCLAPTREPASPARSAISGRAFETPCGGDTRPCSG
jgi:catechol 2,3-dioxygenase-like lactoylglutathione lyase family enzyme